MTKLRVRDRTRGAVKELEDRWERAFNDPDKQRKNLYQVSVVAVVVVGQVKKFDLQHSVTVGVWDDSERSTHVSVDFK